MTTEFSYPFWFRMLYYHICIVILPFSLAGNLMLHRSFGAIAAYMAFLLIAQFVLSNVMGRLIPASIALCNDRLSIAFRGRVAEIRLSDITEVDTNVSLPFSMMGPYWVRVRSRNSNFYIAPYIRDFDLLVSRLPGNAEHREHHIFAFGRFYVIVTRIIDVFFILATIGILTMYIHGGQSIFERVFGSAMFVIPTSLFVIRPMRRMPISIEFAQNEMVFAFLFGRETMIAREDVADIISGWFIGRVRTAWQGHTLILKDGRTFDIQTSYFSDGQAMIKMLGSCRRGHQSC